MAKRPQPAGLVLPLDLAGAAVAAAGLWYSVGLPAAPYEISDWTWVALGVGTALSLASGRLGAVLALGALGWALLAMLALQPLLLHRWTPAQALVPVSALVAAGASTAACTVRGARVSARGVAALLVPWSLAVPIVLAATGSLLLGQLALCAALPALLQALLLATGRVAARGTLLPALVLGQLCVVGGVFFSYTPFSIGAWLLLSPLALYGLDKQTWRAGTAGLAIAAGALLATWWSAWSG